MRTVWKFPLQKAMKQKIEANGLSKLLYVAPDTEGRACVWGVVHTNDRVYRWNIYLIGTGQEFPENVMPDDYLGSIYVQDLIFHVFKTKG